MYVKTRKKICFSTSVLEVFPKLYAFNFDISGYTIIKKFMLTIGIVNTILFDIETTTKNVALAIV